MNFENPNFEESEKKEDKDSNSIEGWALLMSAMSGHIEEVEKILEKYNFEDEEVRLAVGACFDQCLSMGSIDIAKEISEKYKLPAKDIQESAQNNFIGRLKAGYATDSREIGERFGLSREFIEGESQKKYLEMLSIGRIASAQSLEEVFNISEDFINSDSVKIAAQKGFISSLKEGDHLSFLEFEKEFDFSDDFIGSEEVKKSAEDGFTNHLERNNNVINYDFLNHIKEKFSLSENIVNEAAQKGFKYQLKYECFDDCEKIKENYNLSDEFVQNTAQELFFSYLFHPVGINEAKNIEKKFNISQEFIQEIISKDVFDYYLKRDIETFLEIKRNFNVEIDIQEVIDRNSEISSFVNRIKDELPETYEQIFSNFNVFINLLSFRKYQDKYFELIKDHPFLENVIKNNDKYGKKLFLKFGKFDDISKRNIAFLYNCKKEILNDNHNIDENSPEFRELLQDKLRSYGNNQETVDKINENRVVIEEWLNYGQRSEFELKEETVDFSKIIETPLNRINVSILKYIDNINEAFSSFESELKNHETKSDEYLKSSKLLEDIKKRIEEEKNKNDPNYKNIEGMERGAADLSQKLGKMKGGNISLYDKIQSRILSLKRSCEEVKNLNETLISLEEKLSENYSSEVNSKILKVKESLKKKFYSLRDNFEHLKDKELSGVVAEVLGKERVDAINQEIGEAVNEDLNHMRTDISDLNRIFSEKQKENNIEGRKMDVNIWNRNPDIDLYQGNYSPCCISIESGCGSSRKESAISDYMTDLAIQVVNITDMEKKIPIAAAWCWLGKDRFGNKCFVVDNIEANTDYTNKYPQLLSGKLREYILNYAKASGFEEKDIFQGEDNNDLILGFPSPEERDVIKIGPSNRPGGYYLEAEGDLEAEE